MEAGCFGSSDREEAMHDRLACYYCLLYNFFFSFCSSTRLTTFGYVVSIFFFPTQVTKKTMGFFLYPYTSIKNPFCLLHVSFGFSLSTYLPLPNYTPSSSLLPSCFFIPFILSLSLLYSTLHFTTSA